MQMDTQSLRALTSYVEFELRFYSNRTCRANRTEKSNQDIKAYLAHSKHTKLENKFMLEKYNEGRAIDLIPQSVFWSDLQQCFVGFVCLCSRSRPWFVW